MLPVSPVTSAESFTSEITVAVTRTSTVPATAAWKYWLGRLSPVRLMEHSSPEDHIGPVHLCHELEESRRNSAIIPRDAPVQSQEMQGWKFRGTFIRKSSLSSDDRSYVDRFHGLWPYWLCSLSTHFRYTSDSPGQSGLWLRVKSRQREVSSEVSQPLDRLNVDSYCLRWPRASTPRSEGLRLKLIAPRQRFVLSGVSFSPAGCSRTFWTLPGPPTR